MGESVFEKMFPYLAKKRFFYSSHTNKGTQIVCDLPLSVCELWFIKHPAAILEMRTCDQNNDLVFFCAEVIKYGLFSCFSV